MRLRQWKCAVECSSSLKMGTLILWAERVGGGVLVITMDRIWVANSCGKAYTKVGLIVDVYSAIGRSPFRIIML